MKRLVLALLFGAVALLWGDAGRDVEKLITEAASGLSAGAPEYLLDACDPSMPGFDKLRSDVVALLNQAEISNSIEVVDNAGDDSQRTLTLDWVLRLGPKGDSAQFTKREKTVKVRLRKAGKKWKIVSFDPIDLFAL